MMEMIETETDVANCICGALHSFDTQADFTKAKFVFSLRLTETSIMETFIHIVVL